MLEVGTYMRPTTLGEASALLDGSSRIYAGGTFLLQAAQATDVQIERLIDVKAIPELSALHEDGDGVRIGAATTHHALATSPLARERVPILAVAAAAIASRQVRNRATIGGNLCAAEPAFDLPTPLIALGGRVRLCGRDGARELALEEFIPRYGSCARRADELLESIWIPTPVSSRAGYIRCVRSSFEPPLVGVAVAVELDEDRRCVCARVVLGNYGEGPVRCVDAETLLSGSPLDDPSIRSAAEAAAALPARSDVRASADARRRLARWATHEALAQALGRRSGVAA